MLLCFYAPMLLCFYAFMLLYFYASMLLCFYASMLLCFYTSMHQLQISPLILLFELERQATIIIYNWTSPLNSDTKSQLWLSLAQLSPGLCLSLFRRAFDRISILIFLFWQRALLIEMLFPFKYFFFETKFQRFLLLANLSNLFFYLHRSNASFLCILWGFALVKFTAARFFLIFAIDCRLG